MKYDDERREEPHADDSIAPEARLAAHLFGELEAEQARALEAELTRSPELAAERDVLARTAALVQDALPPEALSPELRATLLAAAEDQRAALQRSDFQLLPGPARRAAVGLAAAVLALLGLRPWLVDEVAVEPLGETSRVAFDTALAPEREAALERESRRGIGSVEGDQPGAAAGRPLDRSLGQAPQDELEALARLRPGDQLAEDREAWSRALDEDVLGGIAVDSRASNLGITPLVTPEPSVKLLLGAELQPAAGEVSWLYATTPVGWGVGGLQASFSNSAPGPITAGGDAGATALQGPGGQARVGGGGGQAQQQGTTTYELPAASGAVGGVQPQTETELLPELGQNLLLDSIPVEIANGATIAPPLIQGLDEATGAQLGLRALEESQRAYFRSFRMGGWSRDGFGSDDEDGIAEEFTFGYGTSDTDASTLDAYDRFYAGNLDLEIGSVTLEDAEIFGGFAIGSYEARAQELGRTRVPSEPSPDPTASAAQSERRPLPAEEAAEAAARQDAIVERLHGRILSGLQPEEGESADQLFFRYWGDNPWIRTAEQTLSTFAADVDTGSFGVVRRLLRAERLPRPEQVRTEELLNWWRADVPAPEGGEDFRVALEAAPSRFGPRADAEGDVVLLRVALRGRDVDRRARKPLALTLVVDASGSMDDHGRIQLVRDAAKLLLAELSTTDSVALVTFGTEARTLVPMTSAANRGPFEDALDTLDPDGGTNVQAGLVAGYELAAAELTPGAVNRVVFLSDGVGNIGETDQERILARVADERARGVYLSTLGVGYGVDSEEEYADDFLEQLADGGDGIYHNINDAADAERYLVDQFTASLEPIARDVKIQVEFDDDQVAAWRQLGYENRSLSAQQFRDDSVDAGEVHAGHQVNALYELRVRPGVSADAALATVRVRWKQPFVVDAGDRGGRSQAAAEVAQELETVLAPGSIANAFGDTSAGYRRATLVAQLAELLRRSVHAQGDAPSELLAEMEALAPVLADPEFDELLGLLRGVRTQLEALADELGPLDHKVDEIRRRQVDLLAERERESAATEADAKAKRQAEIDRLRAEIERLEAELREALEDQLGPPDAADR